MKLHAFRTTALGLAVAAAIGAAPARAGDLYAPSGSLKDAHVAPPFNWTGRYTGFNIGAAWMRDGVGIAPADATTAAANDEALRTGLIRSRLGDTGTGVIGGVQIGYNVQVQGVVLGIEYDFQSSSAGISRNANTAATVAALPFTGTNTYHADLDWLSTLRGRLGVVVGRSALVYVTAGLAFGEVNRTYATSATSAVAGSGFANGRDSSVDLGWTVGGGLEWALNNRVSIGAEYLYVNLDGAGFRTTRAGGAGAAACDATTCNFRVRGDDLETHVARLKLSLRM